MSEIAFRAFVVIAVVVIVFSIVERLAKRPFLSWTGKPLLLAIATLAVLVLTVTWNDLKSVRTGNSGEDGRQKIFQRSDRIPRGQYR